MTRVTPSEPIPDTTRSYARSLGAAFPCERAPVFECPAPRSKVPYRAVAVTLFIGWIAVVASVLFVGPA